MSQFFESVGERVNLGARVGLGDADEEVVRSVARITREREPARDASLGGEAAQQFVRVARRADDELVEDGRGVGEREAFERGYPPARVGRLLRALFGHLLQTLPPHRRQVDGRGQGDEALVGADVGGRLLAADVLLARGERQDEAAAALFVVSLADEAAGNLARETVARGEEPDERAADASQVDGLLSAKEYEDFVRSDAE